MVEYLGARDVSDFKWTRWFYSGVCRCGHSWEDHHNGCVMNSEYAKLCEDWGQPPYIPQECEYYGCNEDGGLDEKGEPHCGRFVDKETP